MGVCKFASVVVVVNTAYYFYLNHMVVDVLVCCYCCYDKYTSSCMERLRDLFVNLFRYSPLAKKINICLRNFC